MQLRGNAYNSLAHCARTVYGTEGLAAFYVSYPTTLSMTIPFQAIQFSTYESMLKYLNPSRDYSPAMHCAAGAIAGALAASLTTPLDVIKTLLQTRGSSADPEIRNCRGLWHGAQLIYGRNGATGFFRGLQPRVITAMPSTAICWTSYEMAKFWFLGDPKTR